MTHRPAPNTRAIILMQQRLLDAHYPGQVHELAELRGDEVAQVETAIGVTCAHLDMGHHMMVEALLVFHREMERQKAGDEA